MFVSCKLLMACVCVHVFMGVCVIVNRQMWVLVRCYWYVSVGMCECEHVCASMHDKGVRACVGGWMQRGQEGGVCLLVLPAERVGEKIFHLCVFAAEAFEDN